MQPTRLEGQILGDAQNIQKKKAKRQSDLFCDRLAVVKRKSHAFHKYRVRDTPTRHPKRLCQLTSVNIEPAMHLLSCALNSLGISECDMVITMIKNCYLIVQNSDCLELLL